MAMLVLNREVEEKLRAERKNRGIDQHDEVWDGVYVMSPDADDEHQELVSGFDFLMELVIARRGLGRVRPGVNVSDRDEGWTENFRVPDVVVFLQDTAAINRGTYWRGGPDFALEVISPNDRTREKLPFYAKVGVRELLVIDRDPWEMELYRLHVGELRSVGISTPSRADVLNSEVVPLTFRLVPGSPRSRIEAIHKDNGERWLI
jgi:Uma2 family endonuclease